MTTCIFYGQDKRVVSDAYCDGLSMPIAYKQEVEAKKWR